MTRLRFLMPAVLAIVAVVLAFSTARGEAGFIGALGDVPLMPGLTMQDGRGVVFDTPAGRIVEVVARDRSGGLTPNAVSAFYRDTLAQLGWTAAGPNAYKREGEVLRLEFTRNGALEVRYFLKPG